MNYIEEMQRTIERLGIRLKILLDENRSLRLSRLVFLALGVLFGFLAGLLVMWLAIG